jgi:iron complex outermembrane receptor protein
MKRLLPVLIAELLVAAPLHAADMAKTEHKDEHARELDAVVVEADPLRGTYGDLIQPASVLRGPELERRKAATLGETLQREPGVQSSYFGPGVGRPIIRGQDGARVQVLSEGLASMDVSSVSSDHAATIEPFLADQIEVLRGPATLLYGAGAVGGVVNVVDGRIPEQASDAPISGRAQFGGDSVADSLFGMARIELGGERFVLRADAFHRDAGDYAIPGRAEIDADADEPSGTLENSALRTRGGAVGASWIGESGFLGVAISDFRSDYGIPGHAHEHDEAMFSKSEGEAAVRLNLDQTRVDVKGGLTTSLAAAQNIRLRLGHNDYQHVELEGGEVGPRFDNREYSGRLDIVHSEWAGWRGAYGLSFNQRDFAAAGEEAFVPPSETGQFGVFVLEQRDLGAFQIEIGARYDAQSIDVGSDERSADHSGFSASAGASYALTESASLTFGLDRAARLPTAEELFSDGPHAATASYEIGDGGLDEEASNQLEVGLRWRSDKLKASINAFHALFEDFIYLADTGAIEDDLPLRQWTQADTRFTGFEVEGVWHMAETDVGHFDLQVFADQVRARLDGGADLPRIPQSRLGSELRWHAGPWQATVGGVHYFEQDRTAAQESATASFTLWDASLTYALDAGNTSIEMYLKGENLGNDEARLHTSLLKDLAPLPGRNFTVGMRVYF